jgi:ankyrin repeat protein
MKRYFKFVTYLIVVLAFSYARADAYVDFFRAVNTDNVSGVSALLARGFDPNAADEKGNVALYLAMREDCPKVAALLLMQPRLKVDAANAANETPLMMAAMKGRTDWVPRLIERGAQVNREGWTPLHYAAAGPEPALVALLLDRGAAINALAPNGNTALMMAALYGAQDSAELLLRRGADARLRNKAGLSAADFARKDDRERLALKLEQAAR